MVVLRNYRKLENEINDWIKDSRSSLLNDLIDSMRDSADNELWVLKYFHPRYLEGFQNNPRLLISNTAGFTWGDGVYVTPLQYPKSTMMYGRVGVLGWYDTKDKRVYDAVSYKGQSLYQEWITHQIVLYRMLTTTVHAELANRLLRNRFKITFDIDVIYFRPDEEGYQSHQKFAYTNPKDDIWLSITDKAGLGNKGLYFSDEVKECKWIAVLMNEFESEGLKRKALIPAGGYSRSWPVWFKDQNDLIAEYLDAYKVVSFVKKA